MDEPTEIRVQLSGDRDGDYVVVDERPDGTLVLAPSPRPAHRRRARRRRGRAKPETVPEMLEDWGVELGADERVGAFLSVDVDGDTGFAAVTDRRLILVVHTGHGSRRVLTPALAEISSCEPVGRGSRRGLSVRWGDHEVVIRAGSEETLEKLRASLA